jgi:hypothetical protein
VVAISTRQPHFCAGFLHAGTRSEAAGDAGKRREKEKSVSVRALTLANPWNFAVEWTLE